MDAETIKEGKALLEMSRNPQAQYELEQWLWNHRAELIADAARLNGLEVLTDKGACPAVIFDDNGHWAVAFDGMQSVSFEDGPSDVDTTFFVKAADWKDSIRAAIDTAITPEGGEK